MVTGKRKIIGPRGHNNNPNFLPSPEGEDTKRSPVMKKYENYFWLTGLAFLIVSLLPDIALAGVEDVAMNQITNVVNKLLDHIYDLLVPHEDYWWLYMMIFPVSCLGPILIHWKVQYQWARWLGPLGILVIAAGVFVPFFLGTYHILMAILKSLLHGVGFWGSLVASLLGFFGGALLAYLVIKFVIGKISNLGADSAGGKEKVKGIWSQVKEIAKNFPIPVAALGSLAIHFGTNHPKISFEDNAYAPTWVIPAVSLLLVVARLILWKLGKVGDYFIPRYVRDLEKDEAAKAKAKAKAEKTDEQSELEKAQLEVQKAKVDTEKAKAASLAPGAPTASVAPAAPSLFEQAILDRLAGPEKVSTPDPVNCIYCNTRDEGAEPYCQKCLEPLSMASGPPLPKWIKQVILWRVS